MAETKQEEDAEVGAQERNTELRRSLSNAYASLVGDKTNKSFSAFTFEEAMDAQIERIEGAGTELRPNLLDRVARIESRLVQAVEQAKQQAPETFQKPDSSRDVNTSEALTQSEIDAGVEELRSEFSRRRQEILQSGLALDERVRRIEELKKEIFGFLSE